MKPTLTIIFISINGLIHAQVEGTYEAMHPKKYAVTLEVNPDSTCLCTIDCPKYDVQESYSGKWKMKGNKLSIYVLNKKSKWVRISTYRIAEKDGEIIAKGTKPWGRIRIFRKRKYWLRKK